jgi:UBX domain-containing protein 1/4
MKIVTSAVKTTEELEETIKSLMNKNSQESSSSSQSQETSEVVCEGGVCKKPEEKSSPVETEEEKQEKIKKAMKLIEEKRIERIKEEQRLEREREVQRRKDGQEIQNLKKWQKDEELKQLKDDRIKEKLEEKAARQKILDQIAQDKKERAAKFGNKPVDSSEKSTVQPTTPNPTPVVNSNQARIQFKKPNGETEIVTFDSDMLFADLHAFVKSDILNGSSEKFILATTFPRREYSKEDFNKTLIDLKLAPSSVLLIIFGKPSTLQTSSPTSTQSEGSAVSTFTSIFFTILTPILAFFTFLKGFFTRAISSDEAGKRKRDEETLTPNEAAKKRNLNAFLNKNQPSTSGTSGSSSPTGTIPKTNAFKRPNSSNIHRLHENSDDDEDKKTYNGNSTQQL